MSTFANQNTMNEIKILHDNTWEDGTRKVSVKTCDAVCSKQIDIATDGGTIRQVLFTGGCNGNLRGISSLVAGMKITDAIQRLEGIDCNYKGTSCPDQLAKALRFILDTSK